MIRLPARVGMLAAVKAATTTVGANADLEAAAVDWQPPAVTQAP